MALLLLGKALLIGALCLLFRLPVADALHVGLLLAAGGEFAFVVFEAALGDGLLTAEVGQVLMAGVALSMVATPFLAEAGSRVARRLRVRAPAMLASLQDEALGLSGHVIIAGFGRVGQIVAAVLSAAQVPYLALDLDPGRVGICRARGLRVFYGDASRLDVLAAAGAGRASAVVVTMDQPAGVDRAVAALHEHFPALRLFVRSRATSAIAASSCGTARRRSCRKRPRRACSSDRWSSARWGSAPMPSCASPTISAAPTTPACRRSRATSAPDDERHLAD